MCIYIKLHITAQSGSVVYSLYATACNPPGGYLIVNIFLARNARAHSYDSSPCYDRSWPEPHSLDINYVSTLCPKKNMGTKTREMVDRFVPFYITHG